MKTFLIIIFSLISTLNFAQRSTTWKGGTPGKETCWEEARNWSENRVPDEFSDVFIPDVSTSTFHYPVIKEGAVELNSIRMASTAQLTIAASAKLIVYEDTEGVTVDNLILKGVMVVLDQTRESDLKTRSAYKPGTRFSY